MRLNHKSIYYFSVAVMIVLYALYHFLRTLHPGDTEQRPFSLQLSKDNHQIKCDQMPEYPGGTPAIKAFLKSHIIYPAQAIEQNISGKVVVRFRVDTDGIVKDVTILDSKHPLLDSEATRVIRLMPKWKPATLANKPVSVYMMQPVRFKLPVSDTVN